MTILLKARDLIKRVVCYLSTFLVLSDYWPVIKFISGKSISYVYFVHPSCFEVDVLIILNGTAIYIFS